MTTAMLPTATPAQVGLSAARLDRLSDALRRRIAAVTSPAPWR